MGYTSLIKYGEFVEFYEYEKDIEYVHKKRGKRVSSDDGKSGLLSNMAPTGEDLERKQGRREDNAKRAQVAFRRLVISNLTAASRPVLLTLTYRKNERSLSKAYKHFTAFVQSLRYCQKTQFKYIAVPEFQERGAVHFHALVWGLDEKMVLEERETRKIAKLWSHGFIYIKQTDGREGIAFYLAKYMVKAFLDPQLKNQKSYVCSRNLERPVIQKHTGSKSQIELFYGALVKIKEVVYNNPWLGVTSITYYKTA